MRLYHVFLVVSIIFILVSTASTPIGVAEDNPIYVHVIVSDERIIDHKLVLVIRVIIVDNLDEPFRLEPLEPMTVRIADSEGHVIYDQNMSAPTLPVYPGDNIIVETKVKVDVGNTSTIAVKIYSGRYQLISVDGKTRYEVSEDSSYLLEVNAMGVTGVNKEQNRVIIASVNATPINTYEAKTISLEVEALKNNNEELLAYTSIDGGGSDTASILLQIIVITLTLYVANKLVSIFFD